MRHQLFAAVTALLIAFALISSPVAAQDLQEFTGEIYDSGEELIGEGWAGFQDVAFLFYAVVTLTLAGLFGSIIAYHPRTRRVILSVEEAEAPKIYITYSVVGAVIGLMVVQYGLVVGFVVFGIGGLIRFRTTLPTATRTGRLILVTLIGLSAGLNLPLLAVLATAFGFALIYILDARVTYDIEIRDVDHEHIEEAAKAYRTVLGKHASKILGEQKNLAKGRIHLIFQTPQRMSRDDISRLLHESVPRDLRGSVSWETP